MYLHTYDIHIQNNTLFIKKYNNNLFISRLYRQYKKFNTNILIKVILKYIHYNIFYFQLLNAGSWRKAALKYSQLFEKSYC